MKPVSDRVPIVHVGAPSHATNAREFRRIRAASRDKVASDSLTTSSTIMPNSVCNIAHLSTEAGL